MFRRATYTEFIRDTAILKERVPIHRSGAAITVCNYSSATRQLFVDYSMNGTVWENVQVFTRGGLAAGLTVVPRGVVLGGFALPDEHLDAPFLRLRLDAAADEEGLFVQIDTSAPIPDHVNM